MGAIAYDDAIEVVRSGDGETRARLGADPRTPPEFLYYLAEDPDVAVRRAVAENPNTPNKADLLLAKDADMGVRCILARKLVGDGLEEDERAKLWRMGFTILETLMRDQFVQVRRILTNAFHADPAAPHDVVLGLARDAEQEIAAPVLADSPVLTEDDLVSIIEDGAPGWAQEAIAGRGELPQAVADAVIEAGDGRAGATLLARKDVALSQQCLTRAVEQAEKTPEWQSPLVVRPDVKGSLLVRLARFVAAPLLSMLRARPDIDAETAKQVDDAICSRPGRETKEARDAAAAAVKAAPEKWAVETAAEAAARARALYKAGELADVVVSAALEARNTAFVLHAIALRSDIPVDMVKRMMKSQSARTVMALSWRAGLSARFGMELQRGLARIAPTKLLNARGGFDYPMSEEEMKAQLALFT